MSLTVGNTHIAVELRCRVCGRMDAGEFDALIERLLRERPDLLADPETELILVCGACTTAGRCPCCDQADDGDDGEPGNVRRPR